MRDTWEGPSSLGPLEIGAMGEAVKLILHVTAGRTDRHIYHFELSELPLLLGRSRDARVPLPFVGVSRRHAMLERTDGGTGMQVRDLESRGGTFVNGEVTDVAAAGNGSILRLGVAVIRLEIVLPGAPSSMDEDTQSTDTMAAAAHSNPCEMCGMAVDAAALLEGATLLADRRSLCPSCVQQVPSLKGHGPLRFLRPVGEGSGGTVYKALHQDWRRVVAVKTVRLTSEPKGHALERLLREIEIGERLKHPHIVHLHEAMTDGKTFFVAMEFVDGADLDDYVHEQGPLPLLEVARLARELGSALDYAHNEGVVHRDVKPSNVLRAHAGGFHLTDFGLARGMATLAIDGITGTGTGMGTPRYMAPEQIDHAKEAGPAADVYAFAATLHFALTGVAPYAEINNLENLFTAILTRDVEPASHLRPEVPEEVSQLLAHAMLRTPDERPQGALEMAEPIAGLLEAAVAEE